ncbi:hypothetical protein ED733_000205 [Metarhizium rileyi]|uniref:Uncharacterized protein n=1 Tax=Metarhizium rileyi (strain RCEF 4871) TaxID=1649241 RepID=A0A5C6G6D1_METRR|nr:hypothetical protein ED733_000205 [Metarhizium rileyi]
MHWKTFASNSPLRRRAIRARVSWARSPPHQQHTPDGTTDIAEKSFIILWNVRGDSSKFENFKPLIGVVVNNSTDAEVWAAVIDLINTLRPPTPPPSSIAPTFRGTPVKTSSSRLADSETRDIIKEKCTFRNVKGICDKIFNPKS